MKEHFANVGKMFFLCLFTVLQTIKNNTGISLFTILKT
nr:MAG TPA: hypothetical protein [Caudoviricetes sp.]